MSIIFKIEDKDIWQAAKEAGTYQGSQHDNRDGFIHFSTKEQLATTLTKHYAGKTNLVLIAVNQDSLGPALKWEPSRGGALFPHLYAPLSTNHVLWEKPLEQTEIGGHILPKDML